MSKHAHFSMISKLLLLCIKNIRPYIVKLRTSSAVNLENTRPLNASVLYSSHFPRCAQQRAKLDFQTF